MKPGLILSTRITLHWLPLIKKGEDCKTQFYVSVVNHSTSLWVIRVRICISDDWPLMASPPCSEHSLNKASTVTLFRIWTHLYLVHVVLLLFLCSFVYLVPDSGYMSCSQAYTFLLTWWKLNIFWPPHLCTQGGLTRLYDFSYLFKKKSGKSLDFSKKDR